MIPGLEILNLHAQGGMAEVYRARGKGADGQTWLYAVKRILPELTEDPTLRSMFVEEARIASMLVHPNIVRVYDLARGVNDDYYIVMEFLEGRDLAETIDKARDQGRGLPIWLCIHAARRVCKALIYATSQALDREGRPLGLIHRDISPHNIFVCFDGQVKLTDFGVAKVAQSNIFTQVGVTKGKFGYMSPEQMLSDKLDFRSDLFNVGILLYETLTGRQLFFGNSPSQFLQAMLRADVPPLDPQLGVPAELEQLLRRALMKDRGARPESAQQFDDELLAIAERYGLLASREHVSAEIRGIFGSEIETCPVPQRKPATSSKRLTSVQRLSGEREHVPEKVAMSTAQKIVPTQAKTRGLSDGSGEIPTRSEKMLPRPIEEPRSRTGWQAVGSANAIPPDSRPGFAAAGIPGQGANARRQGPSLASKPGSANPRPGTRSARPLTDVFAEPRAGSARASIPHVLAPAVDITPLDDEKTGPRQMPTGKATVIVVGGAGALPLGEPPSSGPLVPDGSEGLDPTGAYRPQGRREPVAKASIVIRSQRVVSLPSSKK